jgi:uncharacterized protein YydD (DUF2326 family)
MPPGMWWPGRFGPCTRSNLITIIRRYPDLGIQPIISMIDSDLPDRSEDDTPVLDEKEIALTLHYETEQGRLFKIKVW